MSSTSPAAGPSASWLESRDRLRLDLAVDRQFPYPIAVAYRILRTDGPSPRRLAGLAGAVLGYLSAIVAAGTGKMPPRAGDPATRFSRLAATARDVRFLPALATWLSRPDPVRDRFFAALEPGAVRGLLGGLDFLARARCVFYSRSAGGRWFVHEAHGSRMPFEMSRCAVEEEPPEGSVVLLSADRREGLVLDPWLVLGECPRCAAEHLYLLEVDPGGARLVEPSRGCALAAPAPPRRPAPRLRLGVEGGTMATPPAARDRVAAGRYAVAAELEGPDLLAAVRLSDGLPVVLKRFRGSSGRDSLSSRFEREVAASAALDHEGVVGVLDSFLEDGRRWVVQELVDGEDLQNVLDREGALDPADACDVALQILDALGHVHERGWVHRDVKPSNLLVVHEPDGSRRWRVRLADFGLARDTSQISVLTAGRAVVGSCHYMSPEQASGAPAGPASDLYSVGVLLHRCLTGSVPFDGDTVAEVLGGHLSLPPPPPSSVRPGLPCALDAVVLVALAKDPAGRFADALSMARALTDAATGLAPGGRRGRRERDDA